MDYSHRLCRPVSCCLYPRAPEIVEYVRLGTPKSYSMFLYTTILE